MAPLTLIGTSKDPLQVDVEPTETTLLDLRYQLFSLTDIAPERLILIHANTRILPDDTLDETRTLADVKIPSGATVRYEDSAETPPKPAIDLSDVQAALRACSTRPAPSAQQPRHDGTQDVLQRIEPYYKAVLKYEDEALQAKARGVMPLAALKEKAKARQEKEGDEYNTFERALAKELLGWFKHDFFEWMDAPECWACGKETLLSGMIAPTDMELRYGASRVEQFDCKSCGATTRFPRYNDAGKLLETRKGRCGEWQQAFTLCCRAAGLTARAVHDFTDHTWTEIWDGGWVHADSCEDVLDEPLLYERGWGKKLNYCIATGVGCVVDVTRRYTANWRDVLKRRTIADEGGLRVALAQRNESAILSVPPSEMAGVKERYEWDLRDLVGGGGEGVGELPGRQSGNKEWVKARGEDGGSK